jgi:hypothetical protein
MTQTEMAVRWGEALDEAFEQAGRDGRFVLLDFFSPT